MGHVLRPLLLAAACFAIAAGPASAAAPRAQAAAQKHAEAALEEADELREGNGVRTGRELTDALRELAVGLRHLRGEERERAAALLARPTDNDPDADPTEQYAAGARVFSECSQNFCVHWVQQGEDLSTLAQARLVLAEAEVVREFENGTLGWQNPLSDAALKRGREDPRVDIYLKELGAENLFGWAATDPGQNTQAQYSYLVLDNDFDPVQYGGVPALDSLRVTLAHEYGHVLQYGYDVLADGWHYESSAVWLEHRMYPAIDDWLRFVHDGRNGAGWASLTELPLTAFDHPDDQPRNAKPYGSVVFNYFLDSRYGTVGDAVQRRAWEVSDGTVRPSTGAYDRAIRDAGGPGVSSDFAAFSAAVAEWRLPQAGFPFAGVLPDVERVGSLPIDGPAAAPRMDHMSFALYDVPDTSAARIRLSASLPAGTRGALAFVARRGSASGGQVTTRLAELPTGGAGSVTLDNPHAYIEGGGRVTAVLVNADATHGPKFDVQRGDWVWSRDRQAVTAAVTTDLNRPAVVAQTPGRDARRVGTAKPVRVSFSKDVTGVDSQSFSLRDGSGKAVPATVRYDSASRTAVLTPAGPLADTTVYTVRLTGTIADGGGVRLAPTEWSFTTAKRGPQATFTVVSKSRLAVRLELRSTDRDRLRWSAKLVSRGGRTVARRTGALLPGASRLVTVPAGGLARARLVVKFEDPQSNRRRTARALRLRR
jgi:hypothetical protein